MATLNFQQLKEMHGDAKPKKVMSFSDISNRSQNEASTMGMETAQKDSESRLQTAGQSISDFGAGGIKGAGSTIKGLGSLGQKFLDTTFNRIPGMDIGSDLYRSGTQESEAADRILEPTNQAQKAGKFAEGVAEFAIPGAKVSKAVKGTGLANILRRSAAQGGTSAGVTAAQEGEVGAASGVNAAIDAAFPVAGGLARQGGRVLKGLAGLVSGKGTDVIDEIIQNPQTARSGLNAADENEFLRESADRIVRGMKKFDEKVGKKYQSLINDASDSTVDASGAFNEVDELLQSRNINITDDGIDLSRTPFAEPADETRINRMVDLLNKQRNRTDITPKELNQMARQVEDLKTRGGNADTDPLINSVKNVLRRNAEQLDETNKIAEANDFFNDRSDFLNVLEGNLGVDLRGPVELRSGDITREQLQKTAQSFGRLFSGDRTVNRGFIKELENEIGEPIVGPAAGYLLNDEISRAGASIGGGPSQFLQALVSPQIVGNTAANIGQIAQNPQVRAVGDILQSLQPAERGVVLNAARQVFGDN